MYERDLKLTYMLAKHKVVIQLKNFIFDLCLLY